MMLTRAEVEAMLVYVAAGDPKTGVETRMTGYIQALARDWLALEAVVARLPKTADGKVIEVDMRVWTKQDCDDDEAFEGWIVTSIGPEWATSKRHFDWVCTNGNGCLTTQVIYSTREAAAAAREGGK